MNVKQIGAVFQHEFFSQWRSLTYWGIILWPLAIGLVFAKYAQWQLPEQIQKLSSQQVAFIWGVGTPTFIFMLCLSYATIMLAPWRVIRPTNERSYCYQWLERRNNWQGKC